MPNLEKVAADLKAGVTTARNTKSTRIWFMVLLLAIILLLYITGVIKKGFAIGLGILILAAIGIETFNYDLDLGKLWETGSIEESRVSHTKDGKIKLMGSCAIPKKWEGDLNCANFKTQEEAQAKYEQCANEIASYNYGIDAKQIKSLDIYRLDGDGDGVVCEVLPRSTPNAPEISNTEEKESVTPTKTSGTKASKSKAKTSTDTSTTSKTPTYSTKPLLRTPNPYPISPATIRTNPQKLPNQ